jgi:hypothetical protein
MNRRNFLRAGALASIAMAFRNKTATAAPTTAPKRFVVWFTPNGVVENAWRPTGGETDFVLPAMLAPLEKYRDKLMLFGPDKATTNVREEVGISMKCSEKLPSGGHGMTMILTGQPDVVVDGATWAGGISVDQHIANTIGKDTRFPSLELQVRGNTTPGPGTRINYAGAGKPLPLENDPLAAFARVVADVAPEDAAAKAALAQKLANRKSVLDTVKGDFASMRATLGKSQQSKLDAHLDSLRSIEKRLLDGGGSVCKRPDLGAAPAKNDWDQYDNMPRIAELQMDILAASFACDLTRVGTLAWTSAASNARHPFLGADEWHHELSHAPSDDLVAREKLIKIGAWHSQQLVSFMDRLAAIPEGDGTVLDNTLIFACNELSDGFYHTHQNMPFFLAGGASKALKMGRYLKFADRAHNDLLVSICNAMGLPDTTFGVPTGCAGALPGLTA